MPFSMVSTRCLGRQPLHRDWLFRDVLRFHHYPLSHFDCPHCHRRLRHSVQFQCLHFEPCSDSSHSHLCLSTVRFYRCHVNADGFDFGLLSNKLVDRWALLVLHVEPVVRLDIVFVLAFVWLLLLRLLELHIDSYCSHLTNCYKMDSLNLRHRCHWILSSNRNYLKLYWSDCCPTMESTMWNLRPVLNDLTNDNLANRMFASRK